MALNRLENLGKISADERVKIENESAGQVLLPIAEKIKRIKKSAICLKVQIEP